MSEINAVVDRYFAFWNEADPARRATLASRVFTDDLRYIGPLITAEGRGEIEAVAQQLASEMPDLTLRPIGEVEEHHDRLRYRWEIIRPDGETRFAAGTDIAIVAEDGRLHAITVFLDQPPVFDGDHH